MFRWLLLLYDLKLWGQSSSPRGYRPFSWDYDQCSTVPQTLPFTVYLSWNDLMYWLLVLCQVLHQQNEGGRWGLCEWAQFICSALEHGLLGDGMRKSKKISIFSQWLWSKFVFLLICQICILIDVNSYYQICFLWLLFNKTLLILNILLKIQHILLVLFLHNIGHNKGKSTGERRLIALWPRKMKFDGSR